MELPMRPSLWSRIGCASRGITNLVGNASKLTSTHGSIALTMHTDDGSAVLRVRDDRVGIAPALLARIFKLFASNGVARFRFPATTRSGTAASHVPSWATSASCPA